MNKGILFSAIMEYLKNNDFKLIDDFPVLLTNTLSSYIETNKSIPNQDQLLSLINKTKTRFFQINRHISKRKFSEELIDELPDINSLGLYQSDETLKVLFLSSNPEDSCPLRLGEEARAIDKAIRSSDLRDKITIDHQWEVRLTELQEHFLRYQPDVVHFSGHGSEYSEIILIDEDGSSIAVPPRALANLFKIFKDQIRIVILNACFSRGQAESIAKHIPYVVGMSDEILDETAIKFAGAFYRAIGYGQSVEKAFDLAINELDLESIQDSDIPILLKK